jgi:hypothetical protein
MHHVGVYLFMHFIITIIIVIKNIIMLKFGLTPKLKLGFENRNGKGKKRKEKKRKRV